MAFEADVRTTGSVAILDMEGDLDAQADEGLSVAHALAIEAEPEVVILDFTDVGFINSTGIALLVRILMEARQQGREVRAAGLTSHYRHIFEITQLAEFMTFHADEPAALAGTAPAGA